MRLVRVSLALTIVFAGLIHAAAQNPPAGGVPGGQRGTPPPAAPGAPGGRGGRGGGRGVQVMTLSTPAWLDGGAIPVKYAQGGGELSPPLAWADVPEGTRSFALIVHDVNAAAGTGTDDTLHWMLWNIPGEKRELAEGLPSLAEWPDGTRQISATGPSYRGPGAPASGPVHHYVFELFALDAPLDVAPVGASPPQTRASVLAAMAGHVRGKAVYVGLFRRSP